MVRTRAKAGKHHEIRRSRERKAKKSATNVFLGEVSFGSGRKKASVSKDSTNVSLEEVDSSSRKKGAKQPLQPNRASRLFRASHSRFLRSSEEGRLLQEGHTVGISNLAISSVGRLSDSLQPTSIDRTQVLHDASSSFKDSSIKLDLFRVQQLSSLQASADKLDIPPAILDNTINLTNIKMPKRFHKYLEETVITSIGKTSSEQDTLEERRHSTFDSEIASSPSPRKPSDKRRRKERHENQQSFQVVFDNDSKQQTSTDSLPSQKADHTQNITLSTPLAAEPFGRKHGRGVDEAEYENALTNLSTTFSPRKYSSRIGDDLSQRSISVTPQDVQPFGQRRKRIENENKLKFGDILSQQSLRLSPRKSASRTGEVSQQSIPKSPQAEQPFGKRQKVLQVEDNFEDILSQSSPRLPPMKSNSKIGEVLHSSISESPQALQPFGERQKRLQNDHFEDILSPSFPRRSPRKHNSKTGKASHNSTSKSPQAVQPLGKSQKGLQNNSLENIVDQSSYRLTPRKTNSKPDEVSNSSISKSPQTLQLFHKRQKRSQNDNFDDILAQSSPKLSQRKSNSKADEFSQNSASESPQTLQLFHKRQKKLQHDHFEDVLAQSSPRLSQRKSNSKADEFSQNSVSESPQTVQPFSKRQKGLQNADKFGEIFNQASPGLSTRKHSTQAVQSFDKRRRKEQTEDSIQDALHQSPVRFSPNKSTIRTEEASQQSIFETPQTTEPFGKREKKTQNGVNFQDILSELSPKSSPRKSNSKIGEVSWKNITELPPSAQLFNDLQKTMQREDNFEGIVSQSPARISPRKLSSKTGEVSQSSFSKSSQAVQPFGKKPKRLQNKDNYEVMASQSFRRTSPRKLNSKTGDISQSSISVTPQAVQPFGKRQKKIQNEDRFEGVLNGSSPRASNSKTGGLSLNSISESSPTAQSFIQTQKRIQNEDKIQDNLRRSSPRLSPRKSSSRTKNVLQDNISESAPGLKQYGNTQNEDSFEDTASQPSPRLSPRKSATTGEVSQNSFSESLPAIQPFGKRLMEVQNKNNFEDVLSQSSPRLSPRKSSSKFREISESLQIVNSFVNRESRTLENAVHENMLDISSPKEIKSKSDPEYTEKTNDVSLVATSAETLKDVLLPDKRQSLNKGKNALEHSSLKMSSRKYTFRSPEYTEKTNYVSLVATSAEILKDVSLPDKRQSLNKGKNALEHSSLKMSSRKYAFRSFIETNKESLENENQESNGDQLSRIGLSSKTTQHITAQKNDAQNSIFETPKSMQTFGLRKMYSNKDSFSSDLEHSSSKVISRDDKMSMKRSFSAISADSSHRLNTAKSQIKHIVEQRAATENLLVGDPELHADSFHENRSEVSSQARQSHSLTAELLRERSRKLSEESPTKQGQKHNDLNVLAHEEAFQAGSTSSQEFTGGSITSEQHGHNLSANRKLAISLRESIMRNQSPLSSSERVEQDTLTKDNSIQNPKNITDQMVLAEKHLIPSQKLNSPAAKSHHLSEQEDAGGHLQGLSKLTSAFEQTAYAVGEHVTEAGTFKPYEPQINNSELGSQKCKATHSEVQRTETIEMVRKDGSKQSSKNPELSTASRVIQNASWGPLDSARMDSSASSLKSNTDDSFYLRLKTKRKRYRKLSQLNKFDGGTSDSSNVSKYASVKKPIFVRKRKHSLNSRNGLVPTKHIGNTESRAVVHKMVAPIILTDAESQVQNVTGHIVADSNMTERINTEDVLHTRIDNERRKEREYQQSSTKKSNYTGLDSSACKPGSEGKTGPGLPKSWLERRGHGQKKQRNVENHNKQLKMPLYHQQWTKENESLRLHLVLKSIAKGNVHQDKKIEDKQPSQPSSINIKAKEQVVIKKNRETNPGLMVNGKLYRAPKLARPKQWVNKHLYDYLMPSITAKYGEANSRTMAEKYVTYLCHQVSTVVRRKNYNNYRINLEKIKKSLYNLGLIKCYNDYFVFIEKYLPFEFRYKAVPCIRAFGKHTGPPWSKDINIFADLGY